MVKRMEIRKYNLEDIALNFFYGSMPKEEDLCDNGYPVFSGYRVVGYSTKYNIENRSLVVVARGVGGTGNVEIAEEKTFLTNLSIAVSIDEKLADIDFLKYYLNVQGLRYLDSGAAQSQITINNLKHHKIFIPSLVNQKQIASILSAYDNLIENNDKRIKILEQMAENLYKEWFVRFRFPGHESTPLENGIPKGWKEEKLSAVFEIKYGKDHKNIEEGLIPIFGSGGIMRYGNKALCSEESVLIPRKGSLNNVMYYKGDFWTVDTMFYTKMKIKHCAKYTYFTLSKIDLEGLNSGASIPSMTTDILYHLKMIVPDESTLITFDKQIDLLFAEKDRLELQNQNLIKQRDLLLPRLMSGKLAV